MNVMTAAYNVVADYPGGAVALAPQLGKNPATLNHEVSARSTHAKFGLADAVKVTHFTGDWRILEAFASEVGALVIPIAGHAGGEVEALGKMAREFAELVGVTGETMADGRVSDNELARLEGEAGDLVAALNRVLALARANNAASKPKAA